VTALWLALAETAGSGGGFHGELEKDAPLHAPEPPGQGHRSGARLGLDAGALPAHRHWWLLAAGRTIGEVLSCAMDHNHPPTDPAHCRRSRSGESSRDQGSRRALAIRPSAASTHLAHRARLPAGSAAAAPAGPAAAHPAHPPAPDIAGSRGSPPLPGS
jgi:hypothetical protein